MGVASSAKGGIPPTPEMVKPTTSGGTRLWVGLVVLCAIALLNVLLLDSSNPESPELGLHSRIGRGRQSALATNLQGGEMGEEEGAEEEDGSLAMFPSISHLLKRDKVEGRAGGGKGGESLPGVTAEMGGGGRREDQYGGLDTGPAPGEEDGPDITDEAEDVERYTLAASESAKLLESSASLKGGGQEHLGGSKGWLSTFRRVVENARERKEKIGADALVDVLLSLLKIKPGSFLEIADSRDGVPLGHSPLGFLRGFRKWKGTRVGASRKRGEWEMRDPHLRARCRENPQHSMCHEDLTPEGLTPLLESLNVPKSVGLVGCMLGTIDFYLAAALLRAFYTPKLFVVAYNRNFGPHDSFAVIPEGAGAWSSDCYYGASALAWQRLMKRYGYTVVASDSDGTLLFFVSNNLLPKDANAATLWSSHWLSQAAPVRAPLFSPCDLMSWTSVSESAVAEGRGPKGKAWEPEPGDFVVLRQSSSDGEDKYAERADEKTGGKREWKVVGAGDGDCREGGQEEGGLVHSGTLLKRDGGAGSGAAKWYNQEGNAMLMAEAKLRKKNHIMMTANMTANGGSSAHEWFSDNWHESVSCAVHAHVGSSYVCDPHRISGCGCLVYSFDDFGDGSFENAILKHVPHCTINVMDNWHTSDIPRNPNIIVHRTARMGAVDGDGGYEAPCGGKPLRAVRQLLGHKGRRLDILRVRLKGAEFDLIEGAAADGSLAGIAAQILIKVYFPLREDTRESAARQEQVREARERRKNAELSRMRDEVAHLNERLLELARASDGRATPDQEALGDEISVLEERMRAAQSNSDDKTTNPSAVKTARLARLLDDAGYAVFSKVPDLKADEDSFSVEYSLVHKDFLPVE